MSNRKRSYVEYHEDGSITEAQISTADALFENARAVVVPVRAAAAGDAAVDEPAADVAPAPATAEQVAAPAQADVLSIDTATGKAAAPELSSERVKDIFSTISKKYERFNAVSSFGAYKIWLADVVAKTPATAESEILDIAGGTGDVTFAIARAKHPRHIQCTDLVNEMLDVARAHYAKGASDGVPVDFEVVDAQEIPYADATYDIVTVAYGIRNMPKREQAISEMYRVLKPGGTLVCLDFSTPGNPVWNGMYNFYLKHMIPFWGGAITGDKSGFVYLSKSIKAFPDQRKLARMFEDAGFVDVTWKNHTGGIAAVHVAHKPR